MAPLTSRAYNGPHDLQAMTRLLVNLREAGQKVYPVATDLFEELADADAQASARLWEDDGGRLVGFSYVSQYQNLVNAFLASEFNPTVEKEMMGWSEAAMADRNLAKGEFNTLDASTEESDHERVALLERNGFLRQEESSILMARSLEDPIPEPVLPPGFLIRPMAGEIEIEAYVQLWRTAFGTEQMTVDYRRTIMSAPDYCPELDLVVVAPGGELAAFCVCQVFPDDGARAEGSREGWTDPVGTHPAYQRLGLALALMFTGMRLLKARGIDTALMGTSSKNVAMRRTAEKAGFRFVSNTLWYSKEVPPLAGG